MTSSASSSDRKSILALAGVLAAVSLQLLFWWNARDLRPDVEILGEAPALATVDLVSLGDRQAFYRVQALALQNAGDLDGRVTPLRDMDFPRLIGWFELMDRLDHRASAVITLAAYFYGQTTVKADAVLIARYLRRHALAEPATKWRFLAHAVYLARYRGDDPLLALEIARDLAALDVPDLPPWTRQMQAFILADVGDREAARDVMRVILETDTTLQAEERHFIEQFLRLRLGDGGDR